MLRKPPHILVTTPESLYLLLTGAKSREMLRNVRTVIVDEIHALARDKRGSHLSLSLARLDQLVRHAADADRPFGHAAADRRNRALPGRFEQRRRRRRAALPHHRHRPRPRARPGHRSAAERAVGRLLGRNVAGDLRAAGRADPRASQHAGVRQHAAAGRAGVALSWKSSSAKGRSPAITAACRARPGCGPRSS